MLRVGWFSTGRGEGSRGFLELIQTRIESGDLDARIEFVFSNREPGEAEGSDRFFRMVEGYGIPLVTYSSRRYRGEHGGGPISRHRDAYHAEVMDLTSGFPVDISVMAGYMLIVSAEMCARRTPINLHPALPWGPSGTWQEVIWELLETGAAESGVMVHVATDVVDEGPVLAYCTFPIRGQGFDREWQRIEGRSLEDLKKDGEDQPLFALIRREGVRRERPLLLESLRMLSEGHVSVSGGRVLDASGRPAERQDLGNEVERHLERGFG